MNLPAVESSGRSTIGAQTLPSILPPLAPRTIEQSGLTLDMVL